MKIESSRTLIDGMFQPAALTIENGRIVDVSHQVSATATSDYLVPGFIDVHYHGCYLANSVENPLESLKMMSKKALLEGTTSFYPTTTSIALVEIKTALKEMVKYYNNQPRGHTQMLGIHLEGPFMQEEYSGSQLTQYFLDCTSELFEDIKNAAEGLIRYVTLAPEKITESNIIKQIVSNDIVVSLGHTGCTFDQAMEAINKGATSATHLYNAMGKLSHHSPGVITACLLDDRVYAQIIVDGHHVSYPSIQLALKCKGFDKVILVTDSNSAKGMEAGEYNLNGREVVMGSDGTVRTKKNNSLAGSTACMNRCIENIVNHCGVTVAEACKMASENVARLMNLKTKGKIQTGFDADLVFMNEKFDIKRVIVHGEEC